jgi:predicted TIM-barrel fold metal-dependent hydrolase
MDEAALEPDLPICDPHHHLWDRPDSRYMVEELSADLDSGHHVERTVFVECGSGYRMEDPDPMRVVSETTFVVAADPAGRIAAIVGFADLRVPEIADVLAAHVDAGAGRFRGIRHVSAFDPSPDIRRSHTNPPPGLLGDAAFRAGFAVLGRAGLSFDAWLYHRQIPELTDLARAHPEVPVVLDHLGGPLGIGPYAGKEHEVLDEWRTAIADLAGCPNVTLKLGGIGMAIYGKGWHKREGGASSDELAQAWGDPIRYCIEQFGADRCMFESNFPVDKVSCSYVALWNGFKKIAAGASPSEKDALFRRSAEAAYRLPATAA